MANPKITKDGFKGRLIGTADSASYITWPNVHEKPGTFTPATHTHTIDQVTDLQSTLNDKAPTSHTHSIDQVTDLQATLNNKASTSTVTAVSDRVTTLESVAHTQYLVGTGSTIQLTLGKTVVQSLTEATTIQVPATPTTDADRLREAVLKIKIGATVPSIIWPSGIVWANGETPTIEADSYYELNFSYCIDKWAVAWQMFKAV